MKLLLVILLFLSAVPWSLSAVEGPRTTAPVPSPSVPVPERSPRAPVISPISQDDKDAAYTKTILVRSEKIVAPLNLTDSTKARKVRDIIAQQYRSLNDIYTERDKKLAAAKELKQSNKNLAQQQVLNAENEVNARLYTLHFDYLSKLMLYLSPTQIDQVKDGMTYGVLELTYKGYLSMLQNLTEEQKLQIRAWLVEAREHAMDAGSSDEKHKWFGKYKGRINNWLSTAGYDLKKEGEDWQKRIKLEEEKSKK